ncbi:LuxR C-terminal-related transcriptional regulator [Nonomuraea sp. NPDC005983]|uniref:ATP-binding protein n=1 Tax=Nonomuraea sp. NPDC005983 TaxID=3155595 RepID=UPI0033A2BDC4
MPWRATLPTATTSFVGRRQEIADVRRMLQRSRLVTITGIAGVGKTRVAVRAAQLMRRAFTDGVHFVELAGHNDPEQAVAQALEVTGDLAGHLAERRLLLVLDTCEHLTEECSALVQALLPAAPGLHVLVTSRHALRAPGEHSVIVRPLAVPGAEPSADLAHVESVALFLDRVTAVEASFELTGQNAPHVAELCRRLEGIPLAIELAAVRVRLLPVERLLKLMDEGGPLGPADGRRGRHSTMQAAIAWSHDLCTPAERLLWERLTVFAGTFDLAAAELVCSDEALPDPQVYPTLAALVEKSIVNREPDRERTRYRMLGSVREFAAARLDGTAEADRLRVRHRDHYAALARTFGSDSGEHDGGERDGRERDGGERDGGEHDRVEEVARIRADWPNFSAALESYAADPESRERGLEMSLRLGYLWMFGGMAGYGRRYLERLLPVTQGSGPVRLGAWLQLAHLALGQGDLPAARRALDEAEEPAARLGALGGLHTSKMLGTLSFCEGDLEAAERHLRESVEGLAPRGGMFLRNATVELGLTLLLAGRTGEADEVLTRARALSLEAGDGGTAAWAELALALVRRLCGELEAAQEMARAALRTQASLQATFGRAFCVEVLGWLAADQGDPSRAVRLLSAAHRLWGYEVNPLFGSPYFAAEGARYHRELRAALGAQYAREAEAGRAMPAEEAIAYALSSGPGQDETADVSIWAPLTPRETDVAELVADGLTNRLIAQRLVVARRTVDTHVENILTKLGFSGRSQIAAWVIRRRRPGALRREEA